MFSVVLGHCDGVVRVMHQTERLQLQVVSVTPVCVCF